MDDRPIGIFDSGVGGLTVAKMVMRIMPHEKIVYFGDTARVPYGTKSKETITRFSKQDIRFLLTQNVKAVIVACNTASSNSLIELQKEFDIPVFGVVEAGVLEAIKTTQNKKIGIIGTSSTIKSSAYTNMIKDINPAIQTFSKACPLFVPLAEEGLHKHEATYIMAKEYTAPLLSQAIDTLVLGCTHYPLLKQCIGEVIGEDVRLVDPAKATASHVYQYLQNHNCSAPSNNLPSHQFFLSDDTDMFSLICQKALKKSFLPTIVDIESF